MHAFLLLGEGISLKEKIEEKTKELQGVPIEFPFAKVADVRDLASFTKFKLTQNSVIILKNFDAANEEAQNAFLKALEEPQENLTYILTATNIDKILPTIASRCQIIEMPVSDIKFRDEDKKLINDFTKAKVGEKLKIVSKITKKDEAINFIKNLILIEHKEFLDNPSLTKLMEEAVETLRNLEANGNVTAQLTNFIVNMR